VAIVVAEENKKAGIGVNPGGVGGRDPPDFGLGVVGVTGRVVGKHYSLFCTERTLESVFFVFFIRYREKLAKNVGVKVGNVNILGEKRQSFELTT